MTSLGSGKVKFATKTIDFASKTYEICLLILYSISLFRRFICSTKAADRIGDESLSSLCEDRHAIGGGSACAAEYEETA